MKIALLVATLLIAVVLSLGMWFIGVVPFTVGTFTLHAVSIYIGVAAVLTVQERSTNKGEQ